MDRFRMIWPMQKPDQESRQTDGEGPCIIISREMNMTLTIPRVTSATGRRKIRSGKRNQAK